MLIELVKFGVGAYKKAAPIEGTIDTAMQELQMKQQQMAQQPPPPNPEVVKMQAEQQFEQMKMQAQAQSEQMKMQATAQADQLRAQADIQVAQAKGEVENRARVCNQDHGGTDWGEPWLRFAVNGSSRGCKHQDCRRTG